MKTLTKIAVFILALLAITFYIWFGSWLIAGVFATTFTAWQFIKLHLLIALVISIIRFLFKN